MVTKEQLARTLAKSEEALNLIGYIPIVSALSAGVRAFGGKLQVLIGLGFAIISLFLTFKLQRNKLRHFMNFRFSLELFLHGISNILRAVIEAVPCLSLVTCLPYDRVFHKRFKYTFEDLDVVEVNTKHVG